MGCGCSSPSWSKPSPWRSKTSYKPSHRMPIHVISETNDEVCGSIELKVSVESSDMLSLIRESVIGKDSIVWTPYGSRRLVYADYTASGRMLGLVEDYLRDVVYPLYANTHTEASATGFQTTVLREEARAIISTALNAPTEDYVTLFVGTGCTGAIDKLGRVLGLQLPEIADAKWALLSHIPEDERPVVFHGPFEHHTNELWWRESIATVVAIPEDSHGRPDCRVLALELQKYAARPLRIGSFSAGSNVTGIRADTTALSELLHAHGALAFFDFAGVGAYCNVDMRPTPTTAGADSTMDAIFMSPHKMIGGPGSSGLLIARRSLFAAKRPTCPGGGTVQYVSPHLQDYERLIEAREDGGTPAILQAIRAGLAFKLKETVGCHTIEEREQFFGRAALKAWSAHPSIILMGADREAYFDFARRVSIISFNIRAPAAMPSSSRCQMMLASVGGRALLHPHFIIQILNDVYGIQARSGCSCAGPYGHRLYGWAEEGNVYMEEIRQLAMGGEHSAKPGWARVNFNYFIGEAEASFIVDAVRQIATDGWKLLPFYSMNPSSGQFIHRTFNKFDTLRSLSELRVHKDGCSYRIPCQDRNPLQHKQVLGQAQAIYDRAATVLLSQQSLESFSVEDYSLPPTEALLRIQWWCTPSAAAKLLLPSTDTFEC